MSDQRKEKTPPEDAASEDGKNGFDRVPLRIHPRVFESLGTNLVTDDVVAVVELVKNSYDAFARNVQLNFDSNGTFGRYLEIKDDGCGMTRDVLEQVWCLVATPFKAENPLVKSGKSQRRVSGEKGLGRLSALRLGKRLRMLTQAKDSPCWEVDIDWSALRREDSLEESFANCRKYPGESPFSKTGSGTCLTICDLNSPWEENHLSDLRNGLGRLRSPFAQFDEFNISLASREGLFSIEINIDPPEFLEKPKYLIRGDVDENGDLRAEYEFAPLSSAGTPRKKTVYETWRNIRSARSNRGELELSSLGKARCGPFDFEIRAWDISAADTEEIAGRFNLGKSQIRKAIRAHKGISIYRDGILVLPKSDKTRDWLGLDLRRISRVGTRLSTNQIVGYVSISAEGNPEIRDTSDRERLVSCAEVSEFEAIVATAVALLENERDRDRRDPARERQKTKSLFERLSANDLLDEVSRILERERDPSKVIASVEKHLRNLEETKLILQDRFVNYSRLATIGAIASMLTHEIRNRTTVIGSFLNSFKAGPDSLNGKLDRKYDRATRAVKALEHLSDKFLPLASRGFSRGDPRGSIVEEQIRECVEIRKNVMEKRNIKCSVPKSRTPVAVDPGELDAIILNLLQNSEYWLGRSDCRKEIDFRLDRIDGGRRVRVSVHDTGPGIDEDDIERIFWPGVTGKPDGTGMGLTVAAELVAAYGGDMSTIYPGIRGGASFTFDLPSQNQN